MIILNILKGLLGVVGIFLHGIMNIILSWVGILIVVIVIIEILSQVKS